MNKFGRVLIPYLTPFDENEAVNYQAFAELIDYTIAQNYVDTVIVSGTTGEFNTLSFDERVKLFETAVRVVNNRKPIIAGTGCASTKETVALTQAAAQIGIETCLVVAPYYCRPTQEAVYEHYYRVAEAGGVDILLYNIPIFTGINMEPELVKRLAAHERIIGIKDEAGLNPVQITDFYLQTETVDPDFILYNGDDLMLMPTLAQGAAGIVSGGSLLVGDQVRKVFEAYHAGKVDESLAIYRRLFKLFKAFGLDGRLNPIPGLRAAVEIVTGIRIGNARGPLNGPNKEERQALICFLKAEEYI
jgi:4-hydroxy-tetrahydrodipicolinate synthase